jgi:hypothetical protein
MASVRRVAVGSVEEAVNGPGWGCTSRFQLTHSLKARLVTQPLNRDVISC